MLAEARARLRTRQKASGYPLYRDDPAGFITAILGETVWAKQREIAEALRDYPAVAVPSCFGSGKSWIAARIVAWWVATGGIAITTSDTYRQVRDILWRELRDAHRKGDLPGHIPAVECRWETGTGAWAIGIKPEDTNREGFQGIHGTRVLTVYDEANGIPAELWEAGRGLAVTQHDRRLAIGNPNEPTGPFFEACRSPNWHVIRIRAWDTPNFTGEALPVEAKAKLVSPSWVDQLRADGLEGTPFWTAKVEGDFPDVSSNAVIPLSWVEDARSRPHVATPRTVGGLDVARFGSDDSVLITGSGNGPEDVAVVHGHDTMQVAGLTAAFLHGKDEAIVAIDVVGVGGGVYDRLREQGYHVSPVNAGESAERDSDRMLNMRSELWWSLREAFREGEVSLVRLSDHDYQRLRSELTAPTYRLTSSGKVQIESKDEMRARGIGSPDMADALCLWYWARSRTRRRAIFAGAV